jgi:hypothetical protein
VRRSRNSPCQRNPRSGLLKHLGVRAERKHVVTAGLSEAIPQPGVGAIGRIAEHRPLDDLPARGALHEPDPKLRVGLERNPLRDLCLAPTLRVLAPVFWQIQRPPQWHRPARSDRVHRHPDLTVTSFAQRSRILPLDPRRVLAVLRKPGVIQQPRLNPNLRRDALR